MDRKFSWAYNYYVIIAVEAKRGHLIYDVKGFNNLKDAKMYRTIIQEELIEKYKTWTTVVRTLIESEDADLTS